MANFTLPKRQIALRLGILLTLLLSLSRSVEPDRPPPAPGRIAIRAEEVPLARIAARRRAGMLLQIEQAWHLTSAHKDFGSLSALIAEPGRIGTVSDNGVLFSIMPSARAQWNGTIAALPPVCMKSVRKTDRDTESLALDPASGTRWIGIEFRNAICRIDADGSARFAQAKAMARWPRTSGAETMLRLADGRFLIIAEGDWSPRSDMPALVYPTDPVSPDAKPFHLRYAPPLGYRPVDAAQLPDGRLLILNRRFSLPFNFSAVLVLADLPAARTQEVISGQVIGWFDQHWGAENWEGIAVEDRGQGDATIWMVSDDNFLPYQRTLLLKLSWKGQSPDQ